MTLTDGLPLGYDQLVLATGSRIVPEAIEHFDTEAHHFYTAEAAGRAARRARRVHGGRIVIGIAGMPYKCPPAPLEVAFLIESELRDRGLRGRRDPSTSARRSGVPSRSRACREMATPILEEKGIELHTFFNVETIDPERKVVQSLEGEELGYDLLILVPPHKGPQFLIDSGLAPAPGGWLPTDRHTLLVGDRPERLRPRRRHRPAALEGRLDCALRGAGRRRADRRRDRGPAAGREARQLRGQGHVLLRDRRRQGHAAPVRLRPPAHGHPSRTASGTSARSSSTRRTGTRCRRAASDADPVLSDPRPGPFPGPGVSPLGVVDGCWHRMRASPVVRSHDPNGEIGGERHDDWKRPDRRRTARVVCHDDARHRASRRGLPEHGVAGAQRRADPRPDRCRHSGACHRPRPASSATGRTRTRGACAARRPCSSARSCEISATRSSRE